MPSVVFGESCGVAAVVVMTGGSYGLSVSSLSGSSLLFSRTEEDCVACRTRVDISGSLGRIERAAETDECRGRRGKGGRYANGPWDKPHLVQLKRAMPRTDTVLPVARALIVAMVTVVVVMRVWLVVARGHR